MNEIELIAYHGWGFDASCWQHIQDLSDDKIAWNTFDRGYFGEAESPEFTKAAVKKAIWTHSFGLHLCSDEMIQQADIIVLFSPFLHFHPHAAQFRRRSKQVVNEMISRFEGNPYKVLKAFYRNVYHPAKQFDWPPENLNQSLLLKDLKMLDQNERPVPRLKEDANVIILHGSDDAIVPKQKARGLYEKLNGRAKYFEIKQSGHALPMTHAQKCWNLIESNLFKTVNEK